MLERPGTRELEHFFFEKMAGFKANVYGETNLDLVFPPDLPFSAYLSQFLSRRAQDRPFSKMHVSSSLPGLPSEPQALGDNVYGNMNLDIIISPDLPFRMYQVLL